MSWSVWSEPKRDLQLHGLHFDWTCVLPEQRGRREPWHSTLWLQLVYLVPVVLLSIAKLKEGYMMLNIVKLS